MKKSVFILSIHTLCAIVLLVAQGLYAEVRATFTATVSCNVSPEVELVTGYLEFWLDDVEFEVTGLPDNEYYIVQLMGDDIHWYVSDDVYGNGSMATIFSEEALPDPDPDPDPDPGDSPDAIVPDDDNLMKGFDSKCKEVNLRENNRDGNHDTLYGPQMFTITFSGVGYYQIGYLENGVERLSAPVAVPLTARTRNAVVEKRSGFFEITLVTPSGDPVNTPRSSGTGQNEFTFDDSNPGVLSINLEASVNPVEVANYLTNAVDFCVSEVGNALPSYSSVSVNLNGNLACTATITGLPFSNSDFGKKLAMVGFRGSIRDLKIYEVFFSKYANNHPICLDCPECPNWFYYWKKGGVCDIPSNTAYINLNIYGMCYPSISEAIILGNQASGTNQSYTFYKDDGVTLITVGGTGKGIKCVAETIAHERFHISCYQLYRGNIDTDGDGIGNVYENMLLGITTLSNDSDTYNMGGTYAKNGDQEIRCRRKEESNVLYYPQIDWANPGCQSAVKFGP